MGNNIAQWKAREYKAEEPKSLMGESYYVDEVKDYFYDLIVYHLFKAGNTPPKGRGKAREIARDVANLITGVTKHESETPITDSQGNLLPVSLEAVEQVLKLERNMEAERITGIIPSEVCAAAKLEKEEARKAALTPAQAAEEERKEQEWYNSVTNTQ